MVYAMDIRSCRTLRAVCIAVGALVMGAWAGGVVADGGQYLLQVSVNGERLEATHGQTQRRWSWQIAGRVELRKGPADIVVQDAGPGFECADAIYVTNREGDNPVSNPDIEPPSLDALEEDGSELLHEYLMRIAREQYEERRKEVQASLGSRAALAERQKRLREQYRAMLGELPGKTPLNAKVIGTIECDEYRVERVMYESRPRHRVTANLYVPTTGRPPWPGVLVACGHSANGKAFEMYQAVSALMAKNGLVALCYDPICQGERHQLLDAPRHGTTTHTLLNAGALLVGRSVVGYEAWDGIRSLDYLLSRPEVDRGKPVGMTGTSGGGTQTTFLMALEDRIGPAAPSCYVMTRMRKFETLGPADGCQHLPGEGAAGFDHADYLIMRAPKPTIILAARGDYFDIDATREAAAEVRKVYEALEQGDGFDLFEGEHQHGFHPPHREAAVHWMRRWLVGDDTPVTEGGIEVHPDEKLWVTRSGQVVEEFEDERTVADFNLERAKELAGARRRFWAEHSVAECLAEVKRLIGMRDEGGPVTVQEAGSVSREGYRIEKLVILREGEVPVPGLLFVPEARRGKLPGTLYVDGRGKDEDAGPDGPIAGLVREGRVVLSIDARGFGETADNGSNAKYYNVEHRVAVLARHIGRPLLGQRVEDVLAAMDVLVRRDAVDASRIDIVGVERGGPVVLHAAALDSGLAAVTVRDSILSWMDDVVARPLGRNLAGHVVPGALTKYDLPDLVRAIGPRRVEVAAGSGSEGESSE